MLRKIIFWQFLLFICFVFFTNIQIKAQVVINEFLASNSGLIIDPDFNESADWLELYNPGSKHFSIGGYYLTDNLSDSTKWQIPENVQIEAGGFLIIWADGYNTGMHTPFKLSASGEELALFSPSGELIDSISFSPQETNISMGRKTDGNSEWSFFTEPTPGATNSSETFEGIVQSVPNFSILGGIINTPITLDITNTFGGNIHYTTDGTEPEISSPIVRNTFIINETSIIRARILKPNYVPGKVITHTYFIDTKNEIGVLPVVSISTNPDNFWDEQKGIYVQDFKPDWEIPVNIELFENDGSDRAGFNLEAGVKVNGLYSWQLPQKMLGVYFRKSYGEGKLDYPLFFDRERKKFDSFALRASGSDWAYTLFRDGMIQSLSAENMDVDFQGQRACVVYVNGQYMGIHNIRSKIDDDFVAQNHNLVNEKFDMIENEDYVEAGSLDKYANFETLYKVDLSVQENYDLVAEEMDIENFTDFIITEIYSQNTSINHNIMAWKPQTGGKWKWILNDLDRGFLKPGSNMISFYVERDVIPFEQLLLNDGYRKYFGTRLADHLFTTFDPISVKATIDEFKTRIETEIPEHIKRWEGTSSNYGDPISSVEYWNNEVNKLKSFADARPQNLLDDLQNYGFEKSEALSVSIYPESAGSILFNGIEIKQAHSQGNYPLNEEIVLIAHSKGGHVFEGWAKEKTNKIIASEEIWKYNDAGEELSFNWMFAGFNDENWSEGQAELGYGDNDENTVLEYGDDSGNKHITSYFRKTFSVETTNNLQKLKLDLKCDDGAVVYLNGVEVVRENLPTGEINWKTEASNSVSGSSEDDYTTYLLENSLLLNGENIIAVEVHQSSGTSSDISFDLEISAVSINTKELFSTSQKLDYTHLKSEGLVAVFESDGSCIVPEEINAELILNKDCSPYKVPNNVLINTAGKLIIEPGVELYFNDDVSIKINGSVHVRGTENEPVLFRSNPASRNKKWGILNFVHADTSYLNNIIIEDASQGNHPLREIAAISAFHSVLNIDGAVIENVYANLVLGRYSDIKVVNSTFHSGITGDLINIKYGKGFIDNCKFTGNEMPDTDAIDFDDITNGVIQNCVISGFYGFNSDGIDIGEKAKNTLIKNVVVYNITDKGISVGQQSSVNISNSVFVNCNQGIAIKDSSRVSIDHCTFYNNGISVAAYEKNAGDAGGNVVVSNSILSNVYDKTYLADAKSTIEISYSASDNELLPNGKNNLFADPEFQNPNLFDFSLANSSVCVAAGIDGNMGTNLDNLESFNQPFISGIAYKSSLNQEIIEFLVLTNSGINDIDISDYEFTKGFTFKFPETTELKAGQKIYITNNSSADFWQNKGVEVLQWESGRLADEGEAIQLENPFGIVIDHVKYKENSNWPELSDSQGIELLANNLDNHFGENWKVSPLNIIAGIENLSTESEIHFYPNPSTGIIYFSGLDNSGTLLNVYNLSGAKVITKEINSSNTEINLGSLPNGIYLLQTGNFTERVILRK